MVLYPNKLPESERVCFGICSPGLFSKATLYNGYTDTMEKMLERLRMDLEYMRTRSLWMDIKIVWLTAMSIFMGKKF